MLINLRHGTATQPEHIGRAPGAIAVDPREHHVLFLVNPDNQQADASKLVMLDSRSGRIVGQAMIRGGAMRDGSAVDEGNHRYCVFTLSGTSLDKGVITTVDTGSMHIIRSVTIPYLPSAIALDSGTHRAFVASMKDSTIVVVDTNSGRVIRVFGVARAPGALGVDDRTHHLFVASANGEQAPYGQGTLATYSTRTGQHLWSMSVGDNPGGIAVDTLSQHVAVANLGNATVSLVDVSQ